MKYAIRFKPDGIYLEHKGLTYKQVYSRESSDYAGLPEARRKARQLAKHGYYKIARIPNTYVIGIFQQIDRI